ncbi:MAG TPA: DUF5683 domain-containing protein [Hymenobacter sp.]
MLTHLAQAQTTLNGSFSNPLGNTLGNNPQNMVPDTAQGRPIAKRKKDTAADSARRTERLLIFRLTRPAKAGLLALIFPGGGQIYNHSYWKLPLVYGGVGAVTAAEFFYQSRYREYTNSKALWLVGKEAQDPGPNSSQETTLANVQTGIVFYRGWRDRFLAYSLVVYGITALDAIVDAHLRDFDVSDDLSLQWYPTLIPMPAALPMPGLALTLNLNSKRSTK